MIADVSPAVIRAQCAADPLIVAREIVRRKIEAELRAAAKLYELGEWLDRVEGARTLAALRVVEAKAAFAYWRHFSAMGLREAKNGNLPRAWLRFAGRNKGAAFLGNQHAAHPVNAMLNYAYVVEAGRLAKALHARGLALTIGFLHADKAGRNSLVWDAIEPRRPEIDARVFAYLRAHEFKRADFTLAGRSTVRLKPPIASTLLSAVLSAPREIEQAADAMLQMIETGAPVLKPIYCPDRRGRPRKPRS
jgi:CRISPR-associated protein Cas1